MVTCCGLEENFLEQRAKLHWLDVGDQNNKTFHNAIRTHQAQYTIREIRCKEGNIVTQQVEIKEDKAWGAGSAYIYSKEAN